MLEKHRHVNFAQSGDFRSCVYRLRKYEVWLDVT